MPSVTQTDKRTHRETEKQTVEQPEADGGGPGTPPDSDKRDKHDDDDDKHSRTKCVLKPIIKDIYGIRAGSTFAFKLKNR